MDYKNFLDYIYQYSYIDTLEPLSSKFTDSDYNEFLKKEFPWIKLLKKDIDKSCEQIFFNKDKKYKKLLLSFIEEKSAINKTKLASYIFIAHKALKKGINKDLVFNKINLDGPILFNSITLTFLNLLIKNYPEKRVLDLIFDENTKEWEDEIKEAIKELKQITKTIVFQKKPKNLQDLHDHFVSEINDNQKFQVKDEPLNPREDLIPLDGKKITCAEKDFFIKIAKTRHDLCFFSLSRVFDNCVGSFSSYFEKGKSGSSTFIGIFDQNKKPLYCIETTKYNFKEARGVSNSLIPKDIKHSLENLLTLTPEVPTDFTPLKHHFLFGYKYNPKTETFFLMFSKNQAIYEYSNVPFDVYEDFVKEERKGAFLNRILKQTDKYPYSRVA